MIKRERWKGVYGVIEEGKWDEVYGGEREEKDGRETNEGVADEVKEGDKRTRT